MTDPRLLLLAISVLLAITSNQAPAAETIPGTHGSALASAQGCMVVAMRSDASTSQQRLAPKDAKHTDRPLDTALFRPMTKQEIRALIEAITPIEHEAIQGQVMRGVVQKAKLSQERMGVLMQDATLLLAELHVQEILKKVRRLATIDPIDRAPLETRLQNMVQNFDHCAQLQFAERGGLAALEQSRAIVQGLQPDLEHVILKGLAPGVVLPPLNWLDSEYER